MTVLPTHDSLVCPETRQPLAIVTDATIEEINSEINSRTLYNSGGALLSEPISGGLLREDGELLYPIVDGIPKMIADEAIPMEQLKDDA